ncbi:MAG: SH3 domain-containing protein [Bacteroidetes bacterium]|nr:SH3 domain-containing protein [Bacteroidota bacterium]
MGLFDIFKKKDSTQAEHPLAALIKSEGIEVENLGFSEDNGILHITGMVDNGKDVRRVTNLMKNYDGIRRVINEIDVRDISDQGIKLKVETKVRFLNMRSGPSTDHDIVEKLPNGTEVTLKKRINDNWLMVKSQKSEGYCNSDYLKPLN